MSRTDSRASVQTQLAAPLERSLVRFLALHKIQNDAEVVSTHLLVRSNDEQGLTKPSLNDMIQANLIPKRKGANIFQSTIYSILCLRPTFKAGLILPELQNVYERLNKAQAR
jgi:hypothetical protein